MITVTSIDRFVLTVATVPRAVANRSVYLRGPDGNLIEVSDYDYE